MTDTKDALAAAKARADAAEQMVAELRETVRDGLGALDDEGVFWHDGCAALSRTEAVAGRWCPVAERDEARKEALEIHAEWRRVTAHNTALSEQLHDLRMVVPERDAAIAARDEAVREAVDHALCSANAEYHHAILQRDIALEGLAAAERARDEAVAILDAERKHSAEELDEVRAERDAAIVERNDAIRARDEVGIQLAAAQAEIARMRPVVEAARTFAKILPGAGVLRDAIRALDAVPGDALAPRITAALEASGIDSANVKGVE